MAPTKTDSPLKFARELGLTTPTPQGMKVNPKTLAGFEKRTVAFDWVHMGTTACTAGQLARTIHSLPFLPPRSGHLGNWQEIAAGRAGALDYNSIICKEERVGFPLIYDFNMTENADLTEGDGIYLPGSVVSAGQRKILPLYTWKDGAFHLTPRHQSYLSPFVLTEKEGGLIPLITFHRQQFSRLPGYHFQSQAQIILSHEPLFRDILNVLINEALRTPYPARALNLTIDRLVDISGKSVRAEWTISGQSFRSGAHQFAEGKSLIEAVILPLRAAAAPHLFMDNPSFFDQPMALCSLPLISLMLALMKPSFSIARGESHPLFNFHMHWGAIGMAGYPPKKHGHFSSHVRYSRPLYQTVIRHFPNIPPVFFALLPAAIYLLWPHEHYAADQELIEDLLHQIAQETNGMIAKPNLLIAKINRIAGDWLERHIRNLSPYFLNRFSAQRSVFNPIALPPIGRSLKPNGFEELTLTQLSMLVGALMEKAIALI